MEKWSDIVKKEVAKAEKEFANHVAEIFCIGGDNPIQILEWRNKDGSGICRVRYLFDTAGQTITISGDLGSAVVCPTWDATLEDTVKIGINPDYFLEKVRASSDNYVYDFGLARKELEEHLRNAYDEMDEDKKENYAYSIEEDVDYIMDFYDSNTGNFILDKCSENILEKRYDSCWTDWLYCFGRCIAPRVWSWLVGMEMAYEQLRKENVVR